MVDRNQVKVQLRNLREWREEYFNGTPLVSDAIYDDVEDQVRAAATELPDGDALKAEILHFLDQVGAPVSGTAGAVGAHWVKVKHKAPAGSLNKAQSDSDFDAWLRDCRDQVGLPERTLIGVRVKTAMVPNPDTDWSSSVIRKFGIEGVVSNSSDSHGLAYEVRHDDGTVGWYSPRELEGPGILRGIWSEKMDGISILLYYEGGHLKQAVTRGDGVEGEDITRNVLKMKGVVPFISGFDGDLRGEIVLTKSDHAKHFPTYANPRNAASGIAKRIDGHGSEHLTVFCYRLRRTTKPGVKAITSKLLEFRVLERLGARLPGWGVFSHRSEAAFTYARYVNGQRANLDYDIDGLVFEFDSDSHMAQLGELNHRPRGAVAFKFPHEQRVSTLRNIEWQVGNTGRITPVAIFDEVPLAGAKVTNASLHNLSNIVRILTTKGITTRDYFMMGDQVLISRRNDVIPYVEALVAEGPVDQTTIGLCPPKNCPVCNTGLTRDGEYLVCPNTDTCSAQVSGAVKKWVAGIGLKGWGDVIIDSLCDQGFVSDPADLYTLDPGELADVQMGGRRIGATADTILAELAQKGRELPLHVFVGSLNIPLCSRSTCQTIADAGFDSIDKMRAATVAQISSIPGMGAGRGQAFVSGLEAKKSVIDRLLANGVQIKARATGGLTGKSFCFTGFRDADLQSKIEAVGGVVKSSAVKNLTYLVAADPAAQTGKAEKARAQGTSIIGIEDAWDMVGGRP